jgi:hypothetical protein
VFFIKTMNFLFGNPFNRRENPDSTLNIISSTPEGVMREIGFIDNPTIIKKVNSSTLSNTNFDMGTIDTFPNSSGVFNSVGPFIVSWQELGSSNKSNKEQAFVGFGKEKSEEEDRISLGFSPPLWGELSTTPFIKHRILFD